MSYEDEDKMVHNKHCKEYKWYPMILPKQERIIAIGDLHGDYNLTLEVLKLANVIDHNNKWIGGNTYVVQIGDQLDNCRPTNKRCDDPTNISRSSYKGNKPEDIAIMEYMNELHRQAEKVGGKVISLLGNHEIMNVEGFMDYVSYQDLKKSGNKKKRINDFKPGNKYAKLMACSRLPAVIIGSFIFVHAGFVNNFMKKLNIKKKDDMYNVSVTLRKWLLGLIDKDNVVNIINAPPDSMFWHRIIGQIPPNISNNDPRCVKYIKDSLEFFNAKSMIIGHTPQFSQNEGINKTCGDQIWRIDFGGSFVFSQFSNSDTRNAQVLEILNDEKINILKKK